MKMHLDEQGRMLSATAVVVAVVAAVIWWKPGSFLQVGPQDHSSATLAYADEGYQPKRAGQLASNVAVTPFIQCGDWRGRSSDITVTQTPSASARSRVEACREEARFPFLHESFLHESRNQVWAANMEGNLNAHFYRQLRGEAASGAQCKTTYCEMRNLSCGAIDADAIDVIVRQTSREYWWSFTLVSSLVHDSGGRKCLDVILRRPTPEFRLN